MFLEESREASCSLLFFLFLLLEVHHLLIKMQEITIDSLLRFKLVESFEEVRNPFTSSRVGFPVLIFRIFLRSRIVLLGRFRELGNLLVELFETVFFEIALQAIIDPLSRNSIDQSANHLDHCHISLILRLAELQLGNQSLQLSFYTGLLHQSCSSWQYFQGSLCQSGA